MRYSFLFKNLTTDIRCFILGHKWKRVRITLEGDSLLECKRCKRRIII